MLPIIESVQLKAREHNQLVASVIRDMQAESEHELSATEIAERLAVSMINNSGSYQSRFGQEPQ